MPFPSQPLWNSHLDRILHCLLWCESRVRAGLVEWLHAFSCHKLQMHSNRWRFTNTTITAICLAYLIFLGLFTPSNMWRGLVIIKFLVMQFLLFASAFGPNAAVGIFPYSLVSSKHLEYLHQFYISPVFKILSLFCSCVTAYPYRYECVSYE